jgi:outer membrane protein assembly factor BamA
MKSKWVKRYYVLVLMSLIPCCIIAQSDNGNSFSDPSHTPANPLIFNNDSSRGSTLFTVRNIIITGNKKTRTQIILREIPFKSGDQYLLQDLVKKFEVARRQLMNTALFNEVVVALKSFDGFDVDVVVELKERWYLFPLPYLKTIDNLDKWVNEYHMKLDRVNYGIKVMYKNPTGRNDNLDVKLMNGYTKQVSFSYDRLYFDKQMKWGMAVKFDLGKNHEVNYNTINDKLVSLRDNNNYIHSFLSTNVELTYRNAIKTRHRFGIGYTEEKVNDTVVTLNQSYFTSGRNRMRYPELYYNMTYFDVDYIPYPLKGYAAEISISKIGLNNIVNMWQFTARGSGSWPVMKKTYFNVSGSGLLKLPFKQPYFNKRFLGSDDMFMQGYEYYVIDGVAGGYLKATFIRELFDFNIRLNSKKYAAINRIPFRFFGKIYGNAGYVYDPEPGNNFLSNKMLYSGGIGIDIVSLYDLTLKLEWSFNPLGQNGIYLHQKSYF